MTEQKLSAYVAIFLAKHPELKEAIPSLKVVVADIPVERVRTPWMAKTCRAYLIVRQSYLQKATKEQIYSTLRHEILHYYLEYCPTRKLSPVVAHRNCRHAHCKHFVELALKYKASLTAYTILTEEVIAARGKPRWKYYCPSCALRGRRFWWSASAHKPGIVKEYECQLCGTKYKVEPTKKPLVKNGKLTVFKEDGTKYFIVYHPMEEEDGKARPETDRGTKGEDSSGPISPS